MCPVFLIASVLSHAVGLLCPVFRCSGVFALSQVNLHSARRSLESMTGDTTGQPSALLVLGASIAAVFVSDSWLNTCGPPRISFPGLNRSAVAPKNAVQGFIAAPFETLRVRVMAPTESRSWGDVARMDSVLPFSSGSWVRGSMTRAQHKSGDLATEAAPLAEFRRDRRNGKRQLLSACRLPGEQRIL